MSQSKKIHSTSDTRKNIPCLDSIDHFHLAVPNKQQAAAWYEDILGFRIVESMRMWNTPEGPLTIENALQTIHIALFEREHYSPLTAIAFKAAGNDFIAWKNYLEEKQLLLRCTDHQITWSLYFNDPYGHQHEITSYEVALISEALNSNNGNSNNGVN